MAQAQGCGLGKGSKEVQRYRIGFHISGYQTTFPSITYVHPLEGGHAQT